MASIAMLLGGAVANAMAFTGSNYLFSLFKNSGVEEERRRHDAAVEQLQAAQAAWVRCGGARCAIWATSSACAW